MMDSATASTTATPAAPAKKSKPAALAPTAKKVASSPVKPAAAEPGKAQKVKLKLVRDSFTMLIDVLKQRAMNFRHAAKKGELLRAGLQVLAALPDAQLEKALARITPLKTGRPKKAD